MSRPFLNNQSTRRLFLDRHLLLREDAQRDLDGLLNGLGFVQVDSVNTLARAHDLILWSRSIDYAPKLLEDLVAQHRSAFEHWTHDAAVIPMQFFPMWRLKFARDEARMRARWLDARRAGWEAETQAVLDHVQGSGPTCSRDVIGDHKPGPSGWWDWHPSKTALEFLWRSGALAVSHRQGFRKFYDLTERVIPSRYLNQQMGDAEIIDWAMSQALTRLGFATSVELAAFFDLATKPEAAAWCKRALADGRILEADFEMADGTLRTSFTTPKILGDAASLPSPLPRVRILSPFDPALRDRARAERLFGFHYRIEIYVPEPKRQYGYYVFPVLQGDQMIGRLDAKRDGKNLSVRAFWPETGVKLGKSLIAEITLELDRIKTLANSDAVELCQGWLRV
jgi:uncharacterized protein YcaQ